MCHPRLGTCICFVKKIMDVEDVDGTLWPCSPCRALAVFLLNAYCRVIALCPDAIAPHAQAVLENYRNCLTTGGPAFLDVDQTNSNNVLIGIATRYDLDWILLRVFTFIGVLCCSGSWRYAS